MKGVGPGDEDLTGKVIIEKVNPHKPVATRRAQHFRRITFLILELRSFATAENFNVRRGVRSQSMQPTAATLSIIRSSERRI